VSSRQGWGHRSRLAVCSRSSCRAGLRTRRAGRPTERAAAKGETIRSRLAACFRSRCLGSLRANGDRIEATEMSSRKGRGHRSAWSCVSGQDEQRVFGRTASRVQRSERPQRARPPAKPGCSFQVETPREPLGKRGSRRGRRDEQPQRARPRSNPVVRFRSRRLASLRANGDHVEATGMNSRKG